MSFFNVDCDDVDNSVPKAGQVRGHGVVVQGPPSFLRKDYVKAHLPNAEGYRTRSEDENVDKFSQKFKEEIGNLHDYLDTIENTFKARRACNAPMKDHEIKTFLGVGEQIKELQQNITSSTRFLSDYLIKTLQQMLTGLTNRYRDVRCQILPAKKFTFNAKKKKQIIKSDLTLDDVIAHNDNCKEKLLAEKRIVTIRTSELSLDFDGCFEKYICEVGNRVNKHDITLTNMRNCFIEIRGHPGSIRLRNIVKCVLLCGPTTFSIYGEDCHQNVFALACHQFRIHYSTSCKIFLHVTSRAIMEDCQEMQIGRYNYKYDGLEQDFKDSGLDVNTNNYADIGDFDWLSTDVPSPNWHIFEEKMDWDKLRQQFNKEQVGKEVNP